MKEALREAIRGSFDDMRLRIPASTVTARGDRFRTRRRMVTAGATAVTVAVSVMFWPETEGLAEEAKEIEVEPALTVRSVLPEIVPLLAVMFVLPVFFAVVKPLPLMIATDAFVELQVTAALRSWVVLSV